MPVVRQVVEEQLKLGGNSVAVTVRLQLDAPRTLELTATILQQQAQSEHPRPDIVEFCLRVGRKILGDAKAILLVGIPSGIAVEWLMHPDEAEARLGALISTIENVLAHLPRLF